MDRPLVRRLFIRFGSSGYVALFEVVDGSTVIIGALRDQREDDYHSQVILMAAVEQFDPAKKRDG